MKALAPDLFQRRFNDLMELGRARLPALAPAWTDHNAHDPGITLMELLAWVAEAQLYSLSRMRRDERLAYAALLGLAPGGTQAARGQIWSDRSDPGAPVATFARSVVIPEDAVINLINADTPTFRPTHRLLWVPGEIVGLQTRGPAGRVIDHTSTNRRGGPAFFPFGETAGRREVLALTFECRDDAGLFGPSRESAKGARWAIGVRAADPLGGAPAVPPCSPRLCRSPLVATLVGDQERVPLDIVADTSEGFLTTGAVLLDLDAVKGSPRRFTIEWRAPGGFARPPRALRIEPDVVPIEQGRSISRELYVSMARPDWSFDLAVPGLRFAPGAPPVTVEVAEAAGLSTWRRDSLAESGPNDDVYELDPDAGRIRFGNGVNGRIPPRDAQVMVSYAVSDADEGNVARNRKWKVAGFQGVFGLNPDPITGGAAPFGWTDQRREARRHAREAHALVSPADLVEAAKALPLLEVVRAWVVPPEERGPRTGVVTLVAMRGRATDQEPEVVPETRRWLDIIRRRLAERLPLGTRLAVVAPRYVGFSIQAAIEAAAGHDPATVKQNVLKVLQARLTLVATSDRRAVRKPGVPVTHRDVAAWVRLVDGVRRVLTLRLVCATGEQVEEISVPPGGLPRWNAGRSDIEVTRARPGGPA